MVKDVCGTWTFSKEGDLHGTYYTYVVTVDGNEQETNDPYAKAAGVNGRRSMVVNLEKTNPEGFAEDKPNRWCPYIQGSRRAKDRRAPGQRFARHYKHMRGSQKAGGGTPCFLQRRC